MIGAAPTDDDLITVYERARDGFQWSATVVLYTACHGLPAKLPTHVEDQLRTAFVRGEQERKRRLVAALESKFPRNP